MFKFLDPNNKILKRLEKIADKVLALAPVYKEFTDEQLQAKTLEFRQRFQTGETLDSLLVEAYANVREASEAIWERVDRRREIP